MGKEKDGIEGDNQYGEELDRFQMSWWTMLREYLTDNASVYIWGNPEPLWRLWHLHLIKSEELAYRNEIVWDKGPGFGQRSHLQRSFSINTERCLFFMRGRQFFGNVNKDDFFEGFEPLRVFFEEQFAIMDWGPADVLRLCGVGMYGHWCTRSQWTLVPSKHYATLQEAAKGRAFVRPYREIRKEYDRARKGGGHLDPIRSFNETRAYFENTHDNMNEVWTFPRVETEERYEHATPKPVQIVERIIRSSCEAGKMFVDPFMGSGSSLIAAEKAGRVCYGIEIAERYCDVICQRWANFTEESPIRESDGARFLDLKG
ncbi:MAG: hypothetical protein GWM98_04805 [Nitrospinaceae bacterium]|nr:hypothetical protein [Nitrospinaceae bacterium]